MNPKLLHNAFNSCGLILTPLYHSAVNWAKKHAENPVYLPMRDAEPMAFVADKMDLGWKRLYINTEIARTTPFWGTPDYPIPEYLKQEGIVPEQPFTLFDTGCRGTIPSSLNSIGYKPQSLYIAAHEKHLKENLPYKRRAFLNDLQWIDEHRCLSLGMVITEHLPKKESGFMASDLIRSEDGVVVSVKPNNQEIIALSESFYDGLGQGVEKLGANSETNSKKLSRYIEFISNNGPRLDRFLETTVNAVRLRQLQSLPTVHYSGMSDDIKAIENCRDKVEQIYC